MDAERRVTRPSEVTGEHTGRRPRKSLALNGRPAHPRHLVTATAALLLATVIAGGGTTSIASAEPRTADAATAKPRWTTVPGAKFTVDRPFPDVLGWASGRAWIGFVDYDNSLKLTSARLAGRRLGAFTKASSTRMDSSGPIVGSELAFQTFNRLRPIDSRLQTVPLLANGQLGTPEEVAGQPDPRAFKLDSLRVSAGARLDDRDVWALVGINYIGMNGARYGLVVCCDTSGASVDLIPYVDRKYLDSARLGVDDRKRLWIAWRDRRSVKIAELDPETLIPRTSPLAAPGGSVERFELACGPGCRVVSEDVVKGSTELFSWAPGERSRTAIARNARLLAASYRSGGRLVVAYGGAGQKIRVVRGNARGARSKVISSLPIPVGSGYPWSPLGYDATFVPGGLVAVVLWENIGSSSGKTRVTATYQPLGR